MSKQRVLTFLAFLLSLWSVLAADMPGDAGVSLYFGAGCFWHMQHVFIEAEKILLGRSGADLTAIVGYAAATAAAPFCYYDGKSHAEVVGLNVPLDKVGDIAGTFWQTFVGKDRSHTNDRGTSYRAVIGLPGGRRSSLFATIDAAQTGRVTQQFTLRDGAGDDPDTLGQPLVWVYDSDVFSFHQAELYHQFHDDYLPGGVYPITYHALGETLFCAGRLRATVCPREIGLAGGAADCSGFNTVATNSGSVTTGQLQGGSGSAPTTGGSANTGSVAGATNTGSGSAGGTNTGSVAGGSTVSHGGSGGGSGHGFDAGGTESPGAEGDSGISTVSGAVMVIPSVLSCALAAMHAL